MSKLVVRQASRWPVLRSALGVAWAAASLAVPLTATAEALQPQTSAATALGFPYAIDVRAQASTTGELMLSLGNTSVRVRPGTVLDGKYRVESVTSEHLDVSLVPAGPRLRIPLSALAPIPRQTTATREVVIGRDSAAAQALLRDAPHDVVFKIDPAFVPRTLPSSSQVPWTPETASTRGGLVQPVPGEIVGDLAVNPVFGGPMPEIIVINPDDPRAQVMLKDPPPGVLFRLDPAYGRRSLPANHSVPWEPERAYRPGTGKVQPVPGS